MKNFRDFYTTVLSTELDIVENKRRNILIQLMLVSIFTISFFSIYFYTFIFASIYPFLLYFYIPTLILVGFGAYKTFNIIIKNTSFYNHFKDKVIFKTIGFINPNLKFDKKFFIDRDQFYNTEIFEKNHKVKYAGDDYVSGYIEDDVSIEFSELIVEYKDDKNKKDKKTNYLFKGILYKAKLPFIFPINFVIEPLNYTTNHKEYYVTDNSEFNKKFQIRILTKSEYNPSLFLTSELLDNIVKFSEKSNFNIHLSFIDSHLHTAIHHDKDLFEPHVFSSNKRYDLIYTHYHDLNFPITLFQNILNNKQI